MLAAPYLLFAGLCGLMYRAIRRARLERERAQQADSRDAAAESPGEPANHTR
jgi:hypothetical protein